MKIEKDKNDGLPEVAQSKSHKNPAIFIMVGFLLLAFITMYFHSKSESNQIKPIEETYTILNDTQAEILKKKPVIECQVSNDETSNDAQKVTQEQIVFVQEKQKELQARLSAPLMLLTTSSTNGTENPPSHAQSASKDPNTLFMNQVSAQGSESATATSIGPLNYIIAEGSLIHGILEPATNSDLPGFLRAVVSEPAYSEDGTRILVPRGSRLIGQYKSGILQGQSRIFIVWTRLITPNGISVNLGSPGVDSLGVSGMGADEIDRHFWERFGTASLLSLIGTGAANVGVKGGDQENSASAYRTAVASSFSQTAGQSLQQGGAIAPTLKTQQGKPIMVFVAKDLNFQVAEKITKPKMNVF